MIADFALGSNVRIAKYYRIVLEDAAMKISMFKFYKARCIFFLIMGAALIAGAIAFTIYFYSGAGIIEDFLLLILAVPMAPIIALLPFFMSYGQMTHVILDEGKCVSYSLLNKKLCRVRYDKDVFYSFFYVKFLYEPEVRFIALSNSPFQCRQTLAEITDITGALKKKFYGTYNQRKIIVFPYDETVAPLLHLDDWHMNNLSVSS